jgi:hypothetical protein
LVRHLLLVSFLTYTVPVFFNARVDLSAIRTRFLAEVGGSVLCDG